MKRKNILKSLLLIMLFICVGLFVDKSAVKVHAYYYGSVDDLKQTGATKNSITVSWTAASGAAKYRVEFKAYSAPYAEAHRVAGTVTGTSHTISGLKSGSAYDVRVTPISTSGEEGGYDNFYDAVTLPDKVAGLKEDVWYSGIKKFYVQWDRLDGVSGYQIEIYNGKGKKIKSATLTQYASSYDQSKVSNSQVYKVKLRAFTNLNGRKYYSKWSEIHCMAQPDIKSLKVKSGKVNLKWSKITGVTGYDIYVSTKKKSGYKKVKSVGKNTTSTTVSKFNKKSFNSKKTYYVYVVAKKKVGKVTHKSQAYYYWYSR